MPADMKLLSTSLSNTSTEIPPKASSPSSAQDIEQALPCNTHTGTQSKQTPQPLALQTHSIPALPLENSHKNRAALPCSGLEVVSLAAEAAKPRLARAALPAAISRHLLHCFSAELLLPGTHGSLSPSPGLSAQHNSAPKSLHVRGIARARRWGFLAAVAAHPIHCLWCMLSKQSPGSSSGKDEESQLWRADKVFCREPLCFHGILKAKGLGMLHLALQFWSVQVVIFCNLQWNSQPNTNLNVSERARANNRNSSQ